MHGLHTVHLHVGMVMRACRLLTFCADGSIVMTDYKSLVESELGMNLSSAPKAAPTGTPLGQGTPIALNNGAVAQDEVEFPQGGGTSLDQLYRNEEPGPQMMHDQPPPAYTQLPIHPMMQQALYHSHTQKDPTLSEEQRAALLVAALCVAVGSPYAQDRMRGVLPAWLVAPEGSTAWPRVFAQASLVAGGFYLLRRYLLK
jgi:hypothetical protein